MAYCDECHWCGRSISKAADVQDPLLYTRDHLYPKSKGGRRVRPACQECNLMKGNMRLEDWVKFTRTKAFLDRKQKRQHHEK